MTVCIWQADTVLPGSDFPDDTILQAIIRQHYENNKIVAAACHGVGGLLNEVVKRSNAQSKTRQSQVLIGLKKVLPGEKRSSVQS